MFGCEAQDSQGERLSGFVFVGVLEGFFGAGGI